MASLRICAAGLALALCACTWVKLEEQGRAVTVARASEVASCEKVAEVSAEVPYRLLFVNRSQTKVARELEALARNRAGSRKDRGNRIVATSPIERGMQSFDVYRCP
jgi:hypothetical protein